MSQAKSAIEHLASEWETERANDSNLDNAWKNCIQMVYQGSIQTLEACSELIIRMDWTSGLSSWVYCSTDNKLTMASHIQPEERCLFAYVIMFCHHRCLNDDTYSWMRMWNEDLDWSNISVAAGSVPLLETIPEWLIESLIMGLMEEVSVIPATLAVVDRGGVDNSFAICKYPVSQIIIEALVGDNPSECLGVMHPLESISWIDAVNLCNKISELFGLPPAYDLSTPHEPVLVQNPKGYRLPTVDEWMLAASLRGNPTWRFSGSDDLWAVGVYDSNSSDQLGRLQPNRLGLFDMSGNVWEWCWDHDDIYAQRKGGSWMSKEEACTVTFASKRRKIAVLPTQGLRLCRSISEDESSSVPEKLESNEWDDWEW